MWLGSFLPGDGEQKYQLKGVAVSVSCNGLIAREVVFPLMWQRVSEKLPDMAVLPPQLSPVNKLDCFDWLVVGNALEEAE